jgi:hypothetical protein
MPDEMKAAVSPDKRSAVMEMPPLQVWVTPQSVAVIMKFLGALHGVFASDEGSKLIDVPFEQQLKFDAALAERLIYELGWFRAALQPEVPQLPEAFPPGSPFRAERETTWATSLDAFGDVVVHIRDPRFGWLNYVMSAETARAYGEKLIERADSAPRAGTA